MKEVQSGRSSWKDWAVEEEHHSGEQQQEPGFRRGRKGYSCVPLALSNKILDNNNNKLVYCDYSTSSAAI